MTTASSRFSSSLPREREAHRLAMLRAAREERDIVTTIDNLYMLRLAREVASDPREARAYGRALDDLRVHLAAPEPTLEEAMRGADMFDLPRLRRMMAAPLDEELLR